MKKNIFKILAIMVAVAGIPVGIVLSRGLKTPWGGSYVAVTSPNSTHWHVVIGIWIAFALLGLFIYCFDEIFVQKRANKFIWAAVSAIYTLGGLSGYLIGFRQGAGNPWAPHGYYVDPVVIPSAVDWTITAGLWASFFVLATILLVLGVWYSRRNSKNATR